MVAGQVTVGVVYMFKVIKIDHHQGEGQIIAPASTEFTRQSLHEIPTIINLGHGIGGGEPVDFLVVGVLYIGPGEVFEDHPPEADDVTISQAG